MGKEIRFAVNKVGKEWVAEASNIDGVVRYVSTSRIKLMLSFFARHPGITHFSIIIPNKELKDVV